MTALRTTRVAALLCLAGLAWLPGCPSDPSAPGCAVPDDCAPGFLCVTGSCQQSDAGGLLPMGSPCASSAGCAVGLECMLDSTGLTGGLCSQACDAAACGTGTCADLRATPVNASICLQACSAANDCRSGWSCCAPLGNLCLPEGLCPLSDAGTSSDLGAQCTSTSCAAGESCRFGPGFPGGACVKTCVPGKAETCPSSGRCLGTPQGPLCAPACTGDADCRTGYACQVPAGGGDKVCVGTAAADRTCPSGGSPVLVAGGLAGPASPPASCVRPIARSSLPAAQVRRLGSHHVGEVLHFDLPAGVGAVSVVEQAVNARGSIVNQGTPQANTAVVTQVKLPDGTVLYDDSAQPPDDPSTALAYYASDSPSTGLLTVPNTTAGLHRFAAGLPGGTWSATVSDRAAECVNTPDCDGGSVSGTYDLSVLFKPAQPASSGTIDIAFYLVGAQGLTSATAVTNAKVQRMISTLTGFYQAAGLCVGSITFYDVPAWARARYAGGINADDSGPCSNLSQMFTLSRAGNTLNFFLVDSITSSGSNGGEIVGLDGTIPGPSTLGGTIGSGAAVNATDLSSGTCGGPVALGTCGADRVAYIAAHEGGHWMGLYHPTEADGVTFDTLADTLTCSCASCAAAGARSNCSPNGDSSTIVTASTCNSSSCGGAQYLMFWLLDDNLAKGQLTAEQGQVARANLLTQ